MKAQHTVKEKKSAKLPVIKFTVSLFMVEKKGQFSHMIITSKLSLRYQHYKNWR